MSFIYHGSPIGNLKIIQPHLSEHGNAYVYGVLNKWDALWYCSDFKGFRFLVNEYGRLDESKVKEQYSGKSGYIYTLNRDDFHFEKGITHWITPNAVNALCYDYIDDIYRYLVEHQNLSQLMLEPIQNVGFYQA